MGLVCKTPDEGWVGLGRVRVNARKPGGEQITSNAKRRRGGQSIRQQQHGVHHPVARAGAGHAVGDMTGPEHQTSAGRSWEKLVGVLVLRGARG